MLDLSGYISVPQAAKELAVHPETVRRLLRQGVLPGSKVGTLWFIGKEDFQDFKATYDPHVGPTRRSETHDKPG